MRYVQSWDFDAREICEWMETSPSYKIVWIHLNKFGIYISLKCDISSKAVSLYTVIYILPLV